MNSESPTQPDTLPDWLETGNTNTPALAGLAASVELILEKGVDYFAENALLQARRLHARSPTSPASHSTARAPTTSVFPW